MGLSLFRLMLSGAAVFSMPVMAGQSKPQASPAQAQPSVEGYLCTFAGKCGAQPDEVPVTRDAPATRGFRLARPAGDKLEPSLTVPRANAVTRSGRRDYREGATGRRNPSRAAIPMLRTPAPSGYGSGYSDAQARQYGDIHAGAPRRGDLMIGFELNSARISSAGLASAGIFAQSLLRPELAQKRFAIEGHTDLRGNRRLNMDLSARRARAVADFLASRGIDRSRLETRGVGPDVPLAGRAATDPQNRRVEAVLLP